jgi:hypothetical protein
LANIQATALVDARLPAVLLEQVAQLADRAVLVVGEHRR